ncbi:class I adenylate-forming enzyme family protein [Rhodococcus globerulus]|uniref:Class I adenylate-forming enzyme family protein n=1 Tax=Rhodococcus globerulus TaxID=33008 RepID=A0ABU4C5P2_RHOGO|nr:class I adenylate-forming enzyme family protein [Rhodococcus globerulus]MDV6271831.1 class I adenylate-forming enzyme family protein [Rhodococcus globerulus]
MTTPADTQAFIASVMAGLTGPGGPFEMGVEDVLGSSMPVMKNRDKSLGDILEASLDYGSRDYLVTKDRRFSYLEHGAAVAALATALRDKYGVGKGDRVGILAANTPEWVITFWAAQALGAIAVGFNSWWVAREVKYGITHTTPTVVIADAKRAHILSGLDTDIPVLTMEEDLPALLEKYSRSPLPHTAVDEDDPAVILYTSGTSGRPKGAVHTHRNVLAVIDYHRYSDRLAAAFTGQPIDDRPSDLRYLLTAPLFHIASLHNLAIPRLSTGGAVIIHQGAFDVDEVLSLVEREKVTNWAVVPTMASRLLEHGDLGKYDLTSLSAFALASAPSSPALQDRLRESLPFAQHSLVDSYGLTESSTGISVATPPELAAFPGTLGRPVIGVSVEIRDAFGVSLPDGEEGEICARSAYVMLGYWNDEAATAAAIGPDRWLRTGDYGVLEDGRLRLTGRRSDLILRGGENIYPLEIEQCLDEHPAVLECIVLGIDSPDLGQEVGAVVVVHSEDAVTEEELRDFASERLAYFKVPVKWQITTTPLPRNATGKTIRTKVVIS